MLNAAKYKLDKKKKITERHGWLSPTGVFYPCKQPNYIYEMQLFLPSGTNFELSHVALARALGYTEYELEELGWIKISANKIIPNDDSHPKITQAQINALFDWSNTMGGYLPSWVLE